MLFFSFFKCVPVDYLKPAREQGYRVYMNDRVVFMYDVRSFTIYKNATIFMVLAKRTQHN